MTVSIPKRGFGGFSLTCFRCLNRQSFQSLRGVLVGFRSRLLTPLEMIEFVSIPKRGFGGFSLTPIVTSPDGSSGLFQSLRGVLVGFRPNSPSVWAMNHKVSIPKRGFGGFSHGGDVTRPRYKKVSIPKRGFGGFSPPKSRPSRGVSKRFQSLRGVLVGFRSFVTGARLIWVVSIPKRGFGGFSPDGCGHSYRYLPVSIPKRGFGGFSPMEHDHGRLDFCFNP